MDEWSSIRYCSGLFDYILCLVIGTRHDGGEGEDGDEEESKVVEEVASCHD
jgi:hypothetical protein